MDVVNGENPTKETQLIKFFVKILKVFSVQRTERIAIRLRFQGRVNR